MRLIILLVAILFPISMVQAAETGSRVSFIQHKWLSGMEQPIQSEGHLNIYPSGIIYWQVTSPFETQMLISDSNIIQFVAGKKAMEVPLNQLPFLQNIRSLLLTLDRQNIRQEISKTYEAEVIGDEAAWAFTLPVQTLTSTPFDVIQFTGRYETLSSVYMKRKTGDQEEIKFGEVNLLPLHEMPVLSELH